MNPEDLTRDDLQRLGAAAVVGVAHLANESEYIGLCDEDDSLEDARKLRPTVLEAIGNARR